MPRNRLRNRDWFQSSFALQQVIESPQKLAPRLRIVFPGILSIEDHRHHGVPPLLQNRTSRISDVAEQMSGSLPRVHPRINETDQVRNGVVPKHHVHGGLAILVAVNVVKPFCQMRGQPAVAVAGEESSGAAAKHFFVGSHPLNTETVRNRQRLFRNASLLWPNAL